MKTDILDHSYDNLLSAREAIHSPKAHTTEALRRACSILMTYGDCIDYDRSAWLISRLDMDRHAAAERRVRRIRRWKLNGKIAVGAALVWAVVFFLKFINGGL